MGDCLGDYLWGGIKGDTRSLDPKPETLSPKP